MKRNKILTFKEYSEEKKKRKEKKTYIFYVARSEECAN